MPQWLMERSRVLGIRYFSRVELTFRFTAIFIIGLGIYVLHLATQQDLYKDVQPSEAFGWFLFFGFFLVFFPSLCGMEDSQREEDRASAEEDREVI